MLPFFLENNRRWADTKEAWLVAYADQNGKRHIETFARKKDADARHAKVQIDIGKGMHVAPSESISMAEAAKNWLDHAAAQGLEYSTLMQYRQHVNLHIVPRIGRTKLAKLTRAQVEQFRSSIMPKADASEEDEDNNRELPHLSLALARKVLTSLKSILKHNGYAHVAIGVGIKRNKRERRALEVGVDSNPASPRGGSPAPAPD
jgi:integrase